MQRLLRLCLWQVLIISISCFSLPISAEEGGIRIRGPKATDAFPYDRYGPIIAKDTLWNIALKVRPDPRLSVYQVMQALYESNPEAFKDNNLNHMINGQYLKIPSIEVMRAIDTANAQQKSRSDDKAWQKKVVKVVAKKAQPPEEMSVKKKDLEAAKSEINVQLKAIDTTQQERLTTIQNDVLDSIDGLQSLLKENEALRQRLSSFNDQLGVMQNEVAKGKEIKMQMDDMIALQQELLAKAEAREQALLLEKQKAELEESGFMSSTWFIVLMATLPAILVLTLLAAILRRKSSKETPIKDTPVAKKEAPEAAPKQTEQVEEPDALDSELSLDDELSLDGELSLDDELSIDLSETDEEHDDLFSDDLDSLDDELLDDDVIQLDDDLDELDDLEDISLDDDIETISLDGDDIDEIVEDEPLEGGELAQGDLDSLLEGLDTEEADSDVVDELVGGVVEQGALDSLLSEDELEEEIVEENAVVNEPDDIDALLEAANEEVVSEDANTELSDPDDIDALLDTIESDSPALEDIATTNEQAAEERIAQDISDPDDIDALLDAVGTDTEETEAPAEDMSQDVSDPDDIDALLDAVGTDTPEAEAPAEDMSQEVSDPDDIDALLDAIGTDTPEAQAPAEDMSQEVSDPDDIDALLDAIVTDTPEAEAPAEDMSQEVSDPDDIDALLDAIGTDTPDAQAPAEDMSEEISDPDDIDALLNAMAGDDHQPAAVNDNVVDSSDSKEESSSSATDVEAATNENIELINNFSDEYVQSFLDSDFSELLAESVSEESAEPAVEENLAKEMTLPDSSPEDSVEIEPGNNTDDISDDFDIDALIDEVNQPESAKDDIQLDIGDELLDTELSDDSTSVESTSFIDDDTLQDLSADFDESTLTQLLNDEKDADAMVELSPDFTDSNVLADLLADDDGTTRVVEDNNNAAEVDDIKELDNLDFDDLLANIEEEASSSSTDEFELSDNFDIGDEIELSSENDVVEDGDADNNSEDFISVDSLLSDSLLDGAPTEPYEKMNIDVGLGEFPEFAGNITEEDMDDDDNGMAAKLDLAKVYIEIGDTENAEVILQDVVKQGDAQQQFDAQQLLDNL